MLIGETTTEIVKRVAFAGLRIAPAAVARRHRRGLIPKPQRRRLGRGRGTESIYPFGTAGQLVALELLIRKYGLNYDRIGWLLWRDGYAVDPQYWRGPLEEACSEYNRTVNRFSDRSEGSKPFLTEAAIEEMENVAKSKNRLNATGFLRRTLRGELFVTFLRTTMQVAMGAFVRSNVQIDHDQDLALRRLLGIAPARKKRKPGLIVDGIGLLIFENMLTTVSAKISKIERNYVSKLPEVEIIEARNELTSILNVFCAVEQVQRITYGRSHPILRLLALIEQNMSVKLHAHIILLWTAVRKIPAVQRGVKHFIDEIYLAPTLVDPIRDPTS